MSGGNAGLVLLDLDHFKLVNDEHGHAAGDAVLVEVVRRLTARVRPGDGVVRWGGEEFAVLLRDMVTSGVVRRNANVRIFREGARIHETTVAQLRRFKDDVREVSEGFECGILLDGFNDLREGDVFEVFETREVERTSLDEAAPAGAVAAPADES